MGHFRQFQAPQIAEAQRGRVTTISLTVSVQQILRIPAPFKDTAGHVSRNGTELRRAVPDAAAGAPGAASREKWPISLHRARLPGRLRPP